MPFVLRSPDGKITRASLRPIHGAEFVPHGTPDLAAFLQQNNVNQSDVDAALEELKKSDGDIVRVIEDLITALLKKNVIKMTDFPKPVQDKLAERVRLRALIGEAYDRASGGNR